MTEPPYTYSPARIRMTAAMFALVFSVLPTLGVAMSLVQLFGVLTRAEAVLTDAEADVVLADLEHLFVGFRSIVVRQQTAVIFAAIAWLAWQYRLVASLLALEIDLETSPWGSVGRWFIPVVNLIWPFRLFTRIDAVIRAGLSLVLRAWWALFLIGAIGPQVMAYGFDRDVDFPVQRTLVAVGTVSEVGFAVAAILAAVVVTRIQRAVNERAEQPAPGMPADLVQT